MNREIKFRAFNHVAKKMYYEDKIGDVFKWQNEGQEQIIMQFTGLKDENGVDIYEGDIVVPVKFDDITSVVRYVSHGFYRVKNHGEKEYCNILGNCKIEVIGNIFENADLL